MRITTSITKAPTLVLLQPFGFGGVGLHTSHTSHTSPAILPISFLRRRGGSAQGIGTLASRGFAKVWGGGEGQTFWFLNQLLGLRGGWVISQRGRHLQSKGSPDTMNCWKRRAFYFLHCYCDSAKLSLGFPEISPNFNFSIWNGESVVKQIKTAPVGLLLWQTSGVQNDP